MHRISFAPELSATLRRVSCWITLLLRLLHDFEHAPALLLGDGARLGDADQVADTALVLLVVHLELRASLDGLAVQAVGLRRADLDDDRLVHLDGDHRAEPDLALAAGLVIGCRRFCFWLGRCRRVGHLVSSAFLRVRLGLTAGASGASSIGSAASAFGSGATATGSRASATSEATIPKSRSRSTVMIRAMSCRTLLIWLEFSSWPTACLKRSSYSSRRAWRMRILNSSASSTLSSSTFISHLRRRPIRRRRISF